MYVYLWAGAYSNTLFQIREAIEILVLTSVTK
jgi:hypothetical protein